MKAIIIADAGGTKTQWLVLPSRSETGQLLFSTGGINASVSSTESIHNSVKDFCSHLKDNLPSMESSSLFFYGAGCNSIKAENRLLNIFSSFPELNLTRQLFASDLEGAARALFHNDCGTACILGTGSASGIFDGETIVESIPSLGFVLGDEGSGAFMGKALLNAYFKRGLSSKSKVLLEEEADLDISHVIASVYRKEAPNRFLASFVPFLKKHEKEEDISHLIDGCLKLFFKKNVLQYRERPSDTVRFAGSVAFLFSDRIKEIAHNAGLNADKFLQNPIMELGEYYKKHFEI